MSNENNESKKPILASLVSGGQVRAIIPSDFDQVYRMAKAIALAGWAPKSYRDENGAFDVNRITIGIIQGLEVGLQPIAALQSIAVINGTPSIWGDGALGIVMSSGLLEDFKETPITDEKGSVTGYLCYAKRRGQATAHQTRFTLQDAAKAGLLNKKGPWTEYPQRMLQMRARAWLLRDKFADVLRGLSIAEETLDRNPIDITPQPEKPRAENATRALDAFAAAGASIAKAFPGAAVPALAHDEPERVPATVRNPTATAEAGTATAERDPTLDIPGAAPMPPMMGPGVAAPDPKAERPSQVIEANTGQLGLIGQDELDRAIAEIPAMPDEIKKAFEGGKWMSAWRWLNETANGLPHREQRQFLVDQYAEVLGTVARYNDSYAKAVAEFCDRLGVSNDLPSEE